MLRKAHGSVDDLVGLLDLDPGLYSDLLERLISEDDVKYWTNSFDVEVERAIVRVVARARSSVSRTMTTA